jgi:alpha-beta hydrolase superfamily lysophospholipase
MIASVRRLVRTVEASRPAQSGRHGGLAYSLWLPTGDRPGSRFKGPAPRPRGGVVVLHGARSCKESHYDYARVLMAAGLAAITFDQRGHGESEGPMDGRALEDVRSMAQLLREACGPGIPIALRGSSMGGYLAILAARGVAAEAVVAICPASGEGLRRAIRAGTIGFDADVLALDAMMARNDLHAEVSSLEIPMLLLHAAGDEQVPVEHSRELAKGLRSPASRLIVVPGGHHRSVQHDAELQAVSVRFIEQALGAASRTAAESL